VSRSEEEGEESAEGEVGIMSASRSIDYTTWPGAWARRGMSWWWREGGGSEVKGFIGRRGQLVVVVLRRMAMWYTTWPFALLWPSHLVKLVQSPVTQQTDQHGFRVCMMS
jgi:hypothetical protein